MNLSSDSARFPPTKGLGGSWERSRPFHLNSQLRKLNAGFGFRPTPPAPLLPTKPFPSSSLLSQSSVHTYDVHSSSLVYRWKPRKLWMREDIYSPAPSDIHLPPCPFPTHLFLFWNYEEGGNLPGHNTAFRSHLSAAIYWNGLWNSLKYHSPTAFHFTDTRCRFI